MFDRFTVKHAYFKGLIDYAGLFPPAKLPLKPALDEYAQHLKEAEAWMVSRFIMPAQLLFDTPDAELQAYLPLDLSVILASTRFQTVEDWLATMAQTVSGLDRLHCRTEGQITGDVLEVVLPKDAQTSAVALMDLLHKVAELRGDRRVFFEVPVMDRELEKLPEVLEMLAAYRDWAGFKLRCGGVEASAFPTVQTVAYLIAACRDAGVPMKFTAGLHHPIRHFNAGVQTYMYGFINVFSAVMLAWRHQLSAAALAQVIAEQDPAAFIFDQTIAWRGYELTASQVSQLRQQAAISYGSCSFKEPREDLWQLGLLPADILSV